MQGQKVHRIPIRDETHLKILFHLSELIKRFWSIASVIGKVLNRK